jgi:cytochrome c
MPTRSLWPASVAVFILITITVYLASRPTAGDASTSLQAKAASPAQCFNPAANIPLTGKTCGPVPDLQLSCYLPADMMGPQPSPSPQPIMPVLNLNTFQRAADIFSWQEFFALNWPADPKMRGLPDVNKKIGDPGPRVWETWKEEYEVYLPGGARPKPWNDREPIPDACADGATKVFFRTQKIDDVVDSTLQAAAATGTLPATLTDQKGKLVRYEIRLNKVLFDYIVQHRLYNANVQTLEKSIEMPDGSVLIKAAWREVTPDEEKRFHTVTACVCDKDKTGKMLNCRRQRMGLVGFHITQKTPFAPQWVWSTFEQVNNVPGSAATGAYSFNNPSCVDCPANQQTPRGTPNQMVRSIPIPNREPDCADSTQDVDNVSRLNDDVSKALAGANSVFQFYELVNTQWPVPQSNNAGQPETAFTVRPLELGNTTMESFVQPTSSCMGCHSTARTVNANRFVSSDFSFTLNNAQPAQTNCEVIPPPTTPKTPWDQAHWADVTLGYTLATQTYEKLPEFVPTAKLHCASCHLNAGGNSDAAWWVDLSYRYKTPAALQARINQCFTNSLNGNPLCTPAGNGQRGDCDANQNMRGFMHYIRWLDEQARTIKLCNANKHGFPPLKGTSGDASAGEAVFIEKCAVCHRLDGQGRYEHNTYYRPALWGPHSFNASAGMFATPKDLAAFVRWNMPLMAGGELSDREAWDVEAYLHTKPRPTPSPSPSP